MTKKSAVVRIALTKPAHLNLESLLDLGRRMGMSRASVFSRIMEWFYDQPDVLRSAIMGTPVPDPPPQKPRRRWSQ